MQKTVAAIIVVIAVMVIVGVSVLSLQNSQKNYESKLETITIGSLPYDYSALIFIADDQNFFAKNGLNATLRTYVSTLDSAKGIENGDVDISLLPEYSIVTEALKKENISVIGSIDKYHSVYLICRKDHGIESISDIKGKRIGATCGTIGEFYLGRFLNLHGINIVEVTLVDMRPTQYVDSLVNGSIDAVITVFKYFEPSKERLGDNFLAWPIQSNQKGYLLLTCRNDWIASHPETIKKLLESIVQAEDYTIHYPVQAKMIVQEQMNYTDENMEAIWPDHQYSLTLDQSLITAMEDEGRWMIKNNLTAEKRIPDFRNYIYIKGLEAVKSKSVNIR